MEIEEIKAAIKGLPDKEIKPLLTWLREYYDGDVWDREIVADIEEFGPERWEAALRQGMAEQGEKHQAVLRLMNNMQFRSDADREECLKDFSLLIGEALDADQPTSD
jgi:hypothetical protein